MEAIEREVREKTKYLAAFRSEKPKSRIELSAGQAEWVIPWYTV